jgi:hypothetical protein
MNVTMALRGALRTVKASFLPLLAAMAIVMISELGMTATRIVPRRTIVSMGPSRLTTFLVVAVVAWLVGRLLVRPVVVALETRCVESRALDPTTLVSFVRRAPALAIAQLLRALVVMVGVAIPAAPALAVTILAPAHPYASAVRWFAVPVCVVVYAYTSASTLLVDRLVCIEALGPIDALRETWRRSHGHWLHLAALSVVTSLCEAAAAFVGMLTFGLGFLVAGPAMRAFADVAFTHAYLQLRVRAVAPVAPDTTPATSTGV